jgi:hypothetical protein
LYAAINSRLYPTMNKVPIPSIKKQATRNLPNSRHLYPKNDTPNKKIDEETFHEKQNIQIAIWPFGLRHCRDNAKLGTGGEQPEHPHH